MAKKKNLKLAIFAPILSLIICMSMFVGTTFAWFTDSVTSANNVIRAGNLDVVLEYKSSWDEDWKNVNSTTKVFKEDALYEPGYTEIVFLRVSNAGTLDFRYDLRVNVGTEVEGTNMAGEKFSLSDYLLIGSYTQDEYASGFNYADILMPVMFGNREAALSNVELTKLSEYDGVIGTNKPSLAGEQSSQVIALVLTMPESVGNEANYRGDAMPSIELAVSLLATQLASESDSFGSDYDEDAAAFTVSAANAMMAENKSVDLYNCNEPGKTLIIPSNYTGTLTLSNVKVAGIIQDSSVVALSNENEIKPANIVVNGNVVVKAVSEGKSAITAKNIKITGDGNLTAIANGQHAYGIGGENTQSINIEGVKIVDVQGGCAGKIGTDTKYYKDAPEGGAAIGSGLNGAVITLKDVEVINAIGGSKSAGIGSLYHTGVIVNIEDSIIKNVVGGATAAAIGGSRVSNGATENGTTINITNSTINAIGGVYGAGIGSGYDTHCQSKQPLTTINITNSTINATGGQYAAGVGTGYHNAALAGEIKNSTINATSGEKVYKATYTSAQDIGFGVVDPAREGLQANSCLIVDGEKIYLDFVKSVSEVTAEKIETYAILENTISADSGKLAVDGGVLDGNGNEVEVTVKGSTDAAITITSGTVKNLDVVHANHSTLGVGIGINPNSSDKLTDDLVIENVSVFYSEDIFDRNILYAIYAETKDGSDVNVVINNSALYGAVDVPGAKNFTATNTTFGSGEFWFMALSGTSTFTDCTFEGICINAYDFAAGKTITFTNCYVGETKLTAENFKSLLIDDAWDYSSDLCSTNMKDCVIVIDGVAVAW